FAMPIHSYALERQACIVLDVLHDEEGPRLPDAGQRDEFVTMQLVEIRHISNADLEKIVEVTGHQIAVEHLLQFEHRPLECCKALRGRSVQHDADHHQCPQTDRSRSDLGPYAGDVTLFKQTLGTSMAGRRAG